MKPPPYTDTPTERSAPHWGPIALASCAVLLHSPFVLWVQHVWQHTPLDEVMLSVVTPLVIAGLLYLRRGALKALVSTSPDSQRSLGGLLLISFGVLVAALSIVNNTVLPLALTAPICLHGYLSWTRGREKTAPILIPIYLLLFLVPGTYGELSSLSLYLQKTSATIATWMLNAYGLPSFLDGITIVTQGTYNHVTEACSGMTTFTALILYSLVFGYILSLSFKHTLLGLSTLLPLTLLVNAARIAFVSLLLLFWGEEVANGPLHDISGYFAFGFAYVALFIFMHVVKNHSKDEDQHPPLVDHAA